MATFPLTRFRTAAEFARYASEKYGTPYTYCLGVANSYIEEIENLEIACAVWSKLDTLRYSNSYANGALVRLPNELLLRNPINWNYYRNAFGIWTDDFNWNQYKPTSNKIYYVKSTGSDVAAGTETAPLKSLSVALAKTDSNQIIIDTRDGDYKMLGSWGWNNVQPTVSMSVQKIGAGRAMSLCTPGSTTSYPAWTLESGSIFKMTANLNSGYSATDLSITDSDGFFHLQLIAASLGAMTAGTIFYDSGTTTLYCWALDSRNLIGDQNMIVSPQTNNIRIPSSALNFWVDGLDAIGGIPVQFTSANTNRPKFTYMNAKIQSSHSASANNYNILGGIDIFSYNIGSARARRDALNYHGDSNGVPFGRESHCYTSTSGYVGTSDNSTTSHEGSCIHRDNGRYNLPLNRNCVDIDTTRNLYAGCYIGQPRTIASAMELLTTSNTAKTWIADVTFEGGEDKQVCMTGTSAIYYDPDTMQMPIRSGTGEDTGTLGTWSVAG